MILMGDVVYAVSRATKVSAGDIWGPRRDERITFARHLAMYLARNLTAESYPTIGRFFGGRHHATVIHGYQMVERHLSERIGYAETVGEIRAELEG